MESLWPWVLAVTVLAVVLWLTSKAVFSAWFKAKEEYVDRIVEKLKHTKGASNGK